MIKYIIHYWMKVFLLSPFLSNIQNNKVISFTLLSFINCFAGLIDAILTDLLSNSH